MIRQRVRRNLDAELLQGCEELLWMADAGDRMHPAALESFQRTRLAADQRSRLGQAARTPEWSRARASAGAPSRRATTPHAGPLARAGSRVRATVRPAAAGDCRRRGGRRSRRSRDRAPDDSAAVRRPTERSRRRARSHAALPPPGRDLRRRSRRCESPAAPLRRRLPPAPNRGSRRAASAKNCRRSRAGRCRLARRCACSCVASQIVNGVLPVPPTVTLPITTTGRATRTRDSKPTRYAARRQATTQPNNHDSGSSASESHCACRSYQTRCRNESAEALTRRTASGAAKRIARCAPAARHACRSPRCGRRP